jgi:putative ABC transport system substrate-binding protein
MGPEMRALSYLLSGSIGPVLVIVLVTADRGPLMIGRTRIAEFLMTNPLFFSERVKLVVLMARHALPTIFADPEHARTGGLISYGSSRTDAYRQAGDYVGRIVRGEKPGGLPVVLPTKFHLVINLKTAKSIGIDVPATVLARADEVIE